MPSCHLYVSLVKGPLKYLTHSYFKQNWAACILMMQSSIGLGCRDSDGSLRRFGSKENLEFPFFGGRVGELTFIGHLSCANHGAG